MQTWSCVFTFRQSTLRSCPRCAAPLMRAAQRNRLKLYSFFHLPMAPVTNPPSARGRLAESIDWPARRPAKSEGLQLNCPRRRRRHRRRRNTSPRHYPSLPASTSSPLKLRKHRIIIIVIKLDIIIIIVRRRRRRRHCPLRVPTTSRILD